MRRSPRSSGLEPGRTGPGPGAAVAAGRQAATPAGAGQSLGLRWRRREKYMTEERSQLSACTETFIRPNGLWSAGAARKTVQLRGNSLVAELLDSLVQFTRLR